MAKRALRVEPCWPKLIEPGETELASAGTQPNEGDSGGRCVKVDQAAGGVASPAIDILGGVPVDTCEMPPKIPQRLPRETKPQQRPTPPPEIDGILSQSHAKPKSTKK